MSIIEIRIAHNLIKWIARKVKRIQSSYPWSDNERERARLTSNWCLFEVLWHTFGIFPPCAVSTIHADSTATTSGAGLPNDFNSPNDALSSEFKDFSAARMIGSASAKSFAHSAWNAMTSYCIWNRNIVCTLSDFTNSYCPAVSINLLGAHARYHRVICRPPSVLTISFKPSGCICVKTDYSGGCQCNVWLSK